jgi:hypothetical protein
MGLTLTQLASDNFQRANESPLMNPPWILSEGTFDHPLCIVSNGVCEGVNIDNGDTVEFYNYANTPNDQFVSLTLGIVSLGSAFYMGVRMTNTSGVNFIEDMPGYLVIVTASLSPAWRLYSNGNFLTLGEVEAVSTGDVWTVAIVGTQISILQNGTLVGSVTDSTYASGQTAAGLDWPSVSTDTSITDFAMGSASTLAPGPTPPFLGSIVEVGSVPSGKTNPFLGTFKVVGAAPGGQAVGQPGNPYLGHIVVVANPPAGYGGTNPVLGEVAAIGSAPAGALDPWLGSAETE